MRRTSWVVAWALEPWCMSPDPSLVDRLARHGQSQLLRWWPELTETQREALQAEVAGIDFPQLAPLVSSLVRDAALAVPPADAVKPVEVVRLPRTDGERTARRHVIEAGVAAL